MFQKSLRWRKAFKMEGENINGCCFFLLNYFLFSWCLGDAAGSEAKTFCLV